MVPSLATVPSGVQMDNEAFELSEVVKTKKKFNKKRLYTIWNNSFYSKNRLKESHLGGCH